MLESPGVASYHYDGHGRRNMSWFTSGGYRHDAYTQDGKLRMNWATADGGRRYVYLGNRLIAENRDGAGGGEVSYPLTDPLGSPVRRTRWDGALIDKTLYEPYGKTVDGLPGYAEPRLFGYTGHVSDKETGLTYMQQRYYDPIAGRFLSVDPVTTSANDGSYFNRYVYAANNPYKYKDPDGRAFETAWDIASLALSVGQFMQSPSLGNALGVAVDAAAVAIPGIPGGVGAFRAASNASDAAAALPRMQGMGATERAKTLADGGFQQTKVSSSAGKNETWKHGDGSEVRVHPYGDVKQGPHKSGNNAHLHKQDPKGNQLNDRGAVTTDKSQQHIGLPNPKDLPQVRGRANGS
jgi:RHS repeat-associated protein